MKNHRKVNQQATEEVAVKVEEREESAKDQKVPESEALLNVRNLTQGNQQNIPLLDRISPFQVHEPVPSSLNPFWTYIYNPVYPPCLF